MISHNQEIGAWGEETAAAWLSEKGCEIAARNVRTPYGEIDIIARKDGLVLFVEVKTLTSSKSFFSRTSDHGAQTRTHAKRRHPLRR
jgi:Holliday junction resolvase-like predicted endonuclease